MRACEQCHVGDRPHLDMAEPCTCGSASPEPTHHTASCIALVHEVVLYPVRMGPYDLAISESGEKELPAYWLQRGWKLMQNGMRWYRIKFLCRDCIGKEEDSQAFKRDYLKACKKAKGQDDQTFAQMLAYQDTL